MVNYEYHEAANIFPLDEDNIQALADDIAKNGQIVPVELCDGKIIDGRRRSAACRIAGVDPIVIEVKPADPVAYAWSINFHRRHLSPAQAAMAGARMREIYDRQAKERQKRKSQNSVPVNLPEQNKDTRDVVGKLVGVSGSTIDHATKVLRKGEPELIAAVDEGRMAVSSAAIVASEDRETQIAAVEDRVKRGRIYKAGEGGIKAVGHNDDHPDEEPPEGQRRGIGVIQANEAINCLIKIPKNDGLRNRGFQLVMDFIKRNK